MDADKHLTARTGPKQLRAPDLAVGGTAGHSVQPGSGGSGQAVTSGVADFICQLVGPGWRHVSPTASSHPRPGPGPGRPLGPRTQRIRRLGRRSTGTPRGSLGPAQGHSRGQTGTFFWGAGLEGSKAETPPAATTRWLSN